MQVNALIETFESSLSHAQGNYQMIVLQSLADCPQLIKSELIDDLMKANKDKTRAFFNSHCVFKVLVKKGLVKINSSDEYSLNLTKGNKGTEYTDRSKVKVAAVKARKKYEADHK